MNITIKSDCESCAHNIVCGLQEKKASAVDAVHSALKCLCEQDKAFCDNTHEVSVIIEDNVDCEHYLLSPGLNHAGRRLADNEEVADIAPAAEEAAGENEEESEEERPKPCCGECQHLDDITDICNRYQCRVFTVDGFERRCPACIKATGQQGGPI